MLLRSYLVQIGLHSPSKSPTIASISHPLFCRLAQDLYFVQNAEGSGLSPFDCFLLLRGVKTMPLRMERQQVSVLKANLDRESVSQS